MNGFRRMLVKELREYMRTYKLYVILGLFLLLGFISPILTKLMPQLLGSTLGEFGIELPEMNWVDSYGQFFKNLTQVGLLAIILTTMGTIAEERSRGIAQLVLTKPLSRSSYVLAKYISSLIFLTLATFLAFGATWFYNRILFPEVLFSAGVLATAIYLVYMAVVLALTLFASALSKSLVAAGGLTVLGIAVLKFLPLFSPWLAKYSPEALNNYLTQAMRGSFLDPSLKGSVAMAGVTIVLFLGAGIWFFRSKEL